MRQKHAVAQLKTVLAPVGKSEGEIFYRGMPLSGIDHRTQSQEIGFVMQNPDNQIVTDKVWHELSFGLESLGYDNATIRLRVAEMASYFGIHQWFIKCLRAVRRAEADLKPGCDHGNASFPFNTG